MHSSAVSEKQSQKSGDDDVMTTATQIWRRTTNINGDGQATVFSIHFLSSISAALLRFSLLTITFNTSLATRSTKLDPQYGSPSFL